MQLLNFSYRPRTEPIYFMDVNRSIGQPPSSIHMHDHHEIVLVTTDTSCKVINNGNTVTIRTPAIWINRAGTFHEVTQITDGSYVSQVLFFHPEVLAGAPPDMRYEKQLFQHDFLGLHLNPEQVQSFLPLFDLLKERTAPQKRLLLLTILCQMAQYVEEGIPSVSTDVSRSYIFDVIQQIRYAEERHTINSLAHKFHVSPTKLKNDFRKFTGMTIGAFGVQIRLRQAIVMLETTNEPVAHIAYACGYSDQSYFIESFRKHYGLTPGDYRANSRTVIKS